MKNKKQLMMGDINMGKETFEGKNSLHDRNNWTSRSWKNDFNRCNQKNSYNKRREKYKLDI